MKILALAVALTCLIPTVACSEASVSEIVIAEGRNGNEPVNPGTVFSSDLPELLCLTRIDGVKVTPAQVEAGDLPKVFHVWSRKKNLGFEEVTRIELSVGGDSWHTRSAKTIHPGYEGEWRVQVVDSLGNVLASQNFKLVAAKKE